MSTIFCCLSVCEGSVTPHQISTFSIYRHKSTLLSQAQYTLSSLRIILHFWWWAYHPFILFCICTEIQKVEACLLEILNIIWKWLLQWKLNKILGRYNHNEQGCRASKLKATTTMSRASIPNACSLVSVVWTPYSMIALQMLCPFQTNSIHICCWSTSIWSPGWSSKLKYPDLK